MWLAGGGLAWDWLALVFLFAVGMSASRRSVLLNHGSSSGALARYSTLNLLVIKGAALGAIVLLWILTQPNFLIPYIVTVCAYVVFVGGIETVPSIRSAFEKLWLR